MGTTAKDRLWIGLALQQIPRYVRIHRLFFFSFFLLGDKGPGFLRPDLPQSRSRMETWRLDVSVMSSSSLLACSDLRSQGQRSILSSTLGFVGWLTWFVWTGGDTGDLRLESAPRLLRAGGA